MVAGAAVGGLLGVATAVPALATQVIEYPVAGSSPNGIVMGPDGALWFTDVGHNSVDRMLADGTLTNTYTIPTNNVLPSEITNGPGGLWFMEGNGLVENIGKITTSGGITEYSSGSGFNLGIAVGPDGNIWFNQRDKFSVAKMTPDGQHVTSYLVPAPTPGSADPVGITAGPDGNMWVTDESQNKVWKVTTNGAFTGYSLPTPNRGAFPITVGADNNLWIGEPSANLIGRMTTAGALTEFPVPTTGGGNAGIALGPDGNVWFTENNANKLAVISPTGAVTEFPIPTTNSLPRRPTAGPDGHVWFPEGVGNVAKIVVENTAAPPWWVNRNLTTTVPKPNGPWFRRAASVAAHAVPASSTSAVPYRAPALPGSAPRPSQTLSTLPSAFAGLGEAVAARLEAILSQ